MTDLIAIPFGSATLALTREAFDTALQAGAELMPATNAGSAGAAIEPLLDAEQAAAALSLTARWLEDCARAGIVPHYKFGRFIRFKVSELTQASRVEGASESADAPSKTLESPCKNANRQRISEPLRAVRSR